MKLNIKVGELFISGPPTVTKFWLILQTFHFWSFMNKISRKKQVGILKKKENSEFFDKNGPASFFCFWIFSCFCCRSEFERRKFGPNHKKFRPNFRNFRRSKMFRRPKLRNRRKTFQIELSTAFVLETLSPAQEIGRW